MTTYDGMITMQEVSEAEAKELINALINKERNNLKKENLLIAAQDNYVTRTNALEGEVEVFFSLQYEGEPVGDLAEYLFSLEV